MADLSYWQSGLVLERGGTAATHYQVRELHGDRGGLGYLRAGTDGVFCDGSAQAVKALQRHLLNNDGSNTEGDGDAEELARLKSERRR